MSIFVDFDHALPSEISATLRASDDDRTFKPLEEVLDRHAAPGTCARTVLVRALLASPEFQLAAAPRTPLEWAIEIDATELVETILNTGCSLFHFSDTNSPRSNTPEPHSHGVACSHYTIPRSPVSVAIEFGRHTTLNSLLLRARATGHTASDLLRPHLSDPRIHHHWCAHQSQPPFVPAVLAPLFERDDAASLRLLLTAGLPPLLRLRTGADLTLLHAAAFAGAPRCAAALRDHATSAQWRSLLLSSPALGVTPLALALAGRHPSVAALLLRHHAPTAGLDLLRPYPAAAGMLQIALAGSFNCGVESLALEPVWVPPLPAPLLTQMHAQGNEPLGFGYGSEDDDLESDGGSGGSDGGASDDAEALGCDSGDYRALELVRLIRSATESEDEWATLLATGALGATPLAPALAALSGYPATLSYLISSAPGAAAAVCTAVEAPAVDAPAAEDAPFARVGIEEIVADDTDTEARESDDDGDVVDSDDDPDTFHGVLTPLRRVPSTAAAAPASAGCAPSPRARASTLLHFASTARTVDVAFSALLRAELTADAAPGGRSLGRAAVQWLVLNRSDAAQATPLFSALQRGAASAALRLVQLGAKIAGDVTPPGAAQPMGILHAIPRLLHRTPLTALLLARLCADILTGHTDSDTVTHARTGADDDGDDGSDDGSDAGGDVSCGSSACWTGRITVVGALLAERAPVVAAYPPPQLSMGSGGSSDPAPSQPTTHMPIERPPLHCAVERGLFALAQLYLDRGADVAAVDSTGAAALALAPCAGAAAARAGLVAAGVLPDDDGSDAAVFSLPRWAAQSLPLYCEAWEPSPVEERDIIARFAHTARTGATLRLPPLALVPFAEQRRIYQLGAIGGHFATEWLLSRLAAGRTGTTSAGASAGTRIGAQTGALALTAAVDTGNHRCVAVLAAHGAQPRSWRALVARAAALGSPPLVRAVLEAARADGHAGARLWGTDNVGVGNAAAGTAAAGGDEDISDGVSALEAAFLGPRTGTDAAADGAASYHPAVVPLLVAAGAPLSRAAATAVLFGCCAPADARRGSAHGHHAAWWQSARAGGDERLRQLLRLARDSM
jgi:ankyrin repeat protein